MKKWFLPITVIGLSGLGVLFGTEKGRAQMMKMQRVRGLADELSTAPQRLSQLNESLDDELASIQSSLNEVARRLGRDVEQVIR